MPNGELVSRIEVAAGPRIIKCYWLKPELVEEFQGFCASNIKPWLEAQSSVTHCDAWLQRYEGSVLMVVSMWGSDVPWDSIVGIERYLMDSQNPEQEGYTYETVAALQMSRTTAEAQEAFSKILDEVVVLKTVLPKNVTPKKKPSHK